MPARALLAKIHIAKKELGLTEDEYRDVLEGQSGKRSSADMSNKEITKCLSHFERLGWVPKSKSKKYENSPRDLYDSSGAAKRKAEVMWHEYHHSHCRCGDEKGHGRRFLFSKFKISDFAFLDRKINYDVIEALKKMLARKIWHPSEEAGAVARPTGAEEL